MKGSLPWESFVRSCNHWKGVIGKPLTHSAVTWSLHSGGLTWEACKKLCWAARQHLALLLAQHNGQENDRGLMAASCRLPTACVMSCNLQSSQQASTRRWSTECQKCDIGHLFSMHCCTACVEATISDAFVDACMSTDATALTWY